MCAVMADTEYISVAEAARIAGYSADYISHLCTAGRVDGVQLVGGVYIVPRRWVEAFANKSINTPTQADAARALGVTRQYVWQLVRKGKLKLTESGY